MPVTDKPFSIGFMGTTNNEVLATAAEFVKGDILMPFTGSGKDVAWLSEEGRKIVSFDTQYLSHLMVNGVFNGKGESNLDPGAELPQVEGYACENPPFRRMDDVSLMIIDGVAQEGTEYDRAALCRAMIQGTIGGRLTHWDTTPNKFADKIRRGVVNNMAFTNLPGSREHHWADAFKPYGDENPLHVAMPMDTIWIDPPKVVTSTDVYSKMFVGINSCLLQEEVELPTWKWSMVIPRHKELWKLPVKRIIQFYCSDVRPTDDAVRAELEQFGEVRERIRIRHGNRADYIYVVDKE